MDILLFCQGLVMVVLAAQIQTSAMPFEDDDDDVPWGRCPSIRNKLKNGRVKIRSRGRVAKFLCDPGYELVGKRFANCLRGQWNNPVPVCVARGCHRMPQIANGKVTEMYRGALLVYDCLPGYTLDGIASVYCDGRRWSTEPPACVVVTSDPKVSCDFEDPDLCGWSHDPMNDFDWRRHQFSTPSGHVGTGPSYDHTFGKGKDGYYLYTEASSPRKVNDTARLFSPVYPQDYSGGCFVFWFHMYGATTGGLRVYIKPESHVFVELSPTWEKFGDQGNQWLRGNVTVPSLSENFQIVIEGIRGTSYVGDTAIDDVNLITSDCDSIGNVTEHVVETGSDSCRGRCREPSDATSCGCNENCHESSTCCNDYIVMCVGGNETSENENPEEYLTPIPSELGTTTMPSTMSIESTNEPNAQTDYNSSTYGSTPLVASSTHTSSTPFSSTKVLTSTSQLSTTTLSSTYFPSTVTVTSRSTEVYSTTAKPVISTSNFYQSTKTEAPTSAIVSTTEFMAVSTVSTTPSAVASSTFSSSTGVSETRRTYNLRPRTTKTTVSYTPPVTTSTVSIRENRTDNILVSQSTNAQHTGVISTSNILSSASSKKPIVSTEDAISSSTTKSPIILITSAPKTTFRSTELQKGSTRIPTSAVPQSTSSTVSSSNIFFSTVSYDSSSVTSILRPLTTLARPTTLKPTTILTTEVTTPSTSSPNFLSTLTIRTRTVPATTSTFSPSRTTQLFFRTSKTSIKELTKSTIKPTQQTSEDHDHASKSASTATNDNQPTITIISVAVVILLCVVGAIIYFKRKQKTIKQSKLSDDSEMRFLSDNEVIEYSDPSVLDKILVN